MNGGNGQRGQADGFGLEILAKLKDVKVWNSYEYLSLITHFLGPLEKKKYKSFLSPIPLLLSYFLILSLIVSLNFAATICRTPWVNPLSVSKTRATLSLQSNQPNVTLLHFIVRVYMRSCGGALSSDCVLPVPEPGDVARAAAVDFADIAAALKDLANQLAGKWKRETKRLIYI